MIISNEVLPFPKEGLTIEESFNKLGWKYKYDKKNETYTDVSCCGKLVNFENMLFVERGECDICHKRLTRKPHLSDACFTEIPNKKKDIQ